MNQRRLAWTVWAVSVAFALVWVLVDASVENSESGIGEYLFAVGGVLLYATIGALITSRQRGNRIGLIFEWVALAGAVTGASGAYARLAVERDLPLAAASTWLANLGVVAIIGPIAFLFLIFPTGSPPSRRWGWLLEVMIGAYAVTLVLFAVTPGRMRAGFADVESQLTNPIGLPLAWKGTVEAITIFFGSIVFIGAIVSTVSLIQRYRGATTEERQQIRWLGWLGGFTAVYVVVFFLLESTGALPEEGVISDLGFVGLIVLLFVGIPVTCGVAILKHGLWDLDVVVKKTVQYGFLVAGFTIVVGLVILLAPLALVGVGGSVDPPTIAIAVLLAIGFTLVRSRARRWANRVVYGQRATPYEVLSEFGERVGETYSTEDVLPRMAQLLGEASGARTATVWLRIGDEMRVEASWPTGVTIPPNVPVRAEELPEFGDEEAFEVKHQGELLGALTVLPAANDPMNPTKEKLIRDMAAQAGLVLRNVRLIEDLRESRRRIVSAQDERARALERNIHDGAQQQLVALSVQLRLAEGIVDRDPAKARVILADLQARTLETLDDLRDLARGIYPPLLADKGLPAALEAQARKSSLPVIVQPDGVDRYGPDVESAVYFCCLEALNNVAKYADASTVEIHLADVNGELRFDVIDDGHGFDPSTTDHGTGLQGMADRLDAIGGSIEVDSTPGQGTRVVGRLPIDGGAG